MSNSTKFATPIKVIPGKAIRWSCDNLRNAKSINDAAPKSSVNLITLKTNPATVQRITADSTTPPDIADADYNPITIHSDVYFIVYDYASISFHALNSNGTKGISCCLNNLRKIMTANPSAANPTHHLTLLAVRMAISFLKRVVHRMNITMLPDILLLLLHLVPAVFQIVASIIDSSNDRKRKSVLPEGQHLEQDHAVPENHAQKDLAPRKSYHLASTS